MKNFYEKGRSYAVRRTYLKGLLLAFFLLGMGNVKLEAQVWTINYCSNLPSSTQSSSYGPMYSTSSANATNRLATIYPASQLAGIANQVLTGVYFHTGAGNTNGMLGTPSFKLWLKEVPQADWGTGALDWATASAGATLLFDGNPAPIVGTTGGWKEFPFTGTFAYSGTQNLALFVEYTNPSASNAVSWSYEYNLSGTCTSANGTKYSNNTTGTLPASLSSSEMRRPYIAFDMVVTCNAPVNVNLSGITTTGVTATWTPGAAETLWEYAVVPAGSGLPTTWDSTTTPSVTIASGLNPSTSYEFYVRSNCGAVDGESVWKGPYQFNTLCGAMPYMFEDFDTYGTGNIVPNCWVRLAASTSAGSQTISSATPASGTRNIYQYASASQNPTIVVLPEFSNVNAGTHWLKFKARVSTLPGALEVGYVSDVTDWNSFVNIQTLDITNTTYNDSYYSVQIPSWIPSTARLAIKNVADAKSYYWDDIYWEPIPTCFSPTDPVLVGATFTSLDISWSAPVNSPTPVQGYEYYISTTNTPPTSSTAATGTSTTTSALINTGLTPETLYYIWVRSVCSATDKSEWSPVLQATTGYCSPVVGTSTTYYLATMTTTGATADLNYTATSYAPYVNNAATSSISAYPTQSFDILLDGSGTSTYYYYVWVDWNNNMSFEDAGEQIIAPAGTSYLATYTGTLTIPAGTPYGSYRVRVGMSFSGVIDSSCGSGRSGNFVDLTLNVTAPPTCIKPSNLQATNITSDSATITWDASVTPPAMGYDIYYSTTNTQPTATTVPQIVNVAGLTSPISGLQSSTTYYVWVRSHCSASDQSAWAQLSGSFMTLCGPMTTMFEDFDTYGTGNIVPECWVRLAASTSAGSQTISSTTPASGTRNIYQYASATQNPTIVVLPEFSNVNAGTHWLKFKARVSTLPGALEVGYVSDVTDWNSFVNIQTLDITNTTYNDSYYSVQIPSWIPSTARLAIKNVADAKSYYWDDIYWEPIPTCFSPTDPVLVGATFTSLDISWSAPVNSPTPVQGYEYYISTTNTPPTSSTAATGTSTTTSALINTGLTPETLYYIWVRSVCSATDKSEWSPVLQATTGYCSPVVGTSTTYYLATMTTTGATADLNYTATSYAPYVNNAATSSISAYPTQSFDILLDGSGTSTYYYYVWVDWNNNMSFEDAGEKIISADASYLATYTGTLTIPAGTPFGSYRVRVGMSYSGVIDSSCGSGRNGNFVDLTLNVIAPPSCVAPTNIQVSNVTHDSATVSWDASVTPPAMGYDVYYSITNTPPTATTVPQVLNAPGLSANITGLTPITTYYVWVRSHCGSADQSLWTSVPVTAITLCQPPAITGTTSSTSATPMCMNDTATLTATADAGANIIWYDAPTGGNEVGTGATFTTPALTASTNYYVAASFGGTQSAALTNATSTSGYTQEAGLFFDASASFVLEGVYVYPIGTGAGDVVIALQDGNVSPAVTLQTVTVNLTGTAAPYVKTYVPLNFNIVPGTNYKLMMMSRSGGVSSLIRESGSAWGTYPLTVPSVMSITNGNCCSGNTTSTSYYYFYDWQISTKCEGARVAVAVDVNTACSLSTSEISKDDQSVRVYPNPFTDVITISDAKNLKSVTVMDASGRMVKTIANPGAQIHLGELKSGLYLLNLRYADGNTTTVKVIKR